MELAKTFWGFNKSIFKESGFEFMKLRYKLDVYLRENAFYLTILAYL